MTETLRLLSQMNPWLALAIAGYHYTLIRTRTREGCFRAFNHNNWLGAAVFAGIAGEYWRLYLRLPGSL